MTSIYRRHLASSKDIVVPLAVLVVLVMATSALSPSMLAPASLTGFLVDASPLLVLVVAGTLPILMGSIDLSIAGMAMLAGVLVVEWHEPFGAATPIFVFCVCAALGAVQGLIHVWTQTPSFITSLGMLGVLSGASLLISGATSKPVPDDDRFIAFVGQSTAGIPHSLLIVAAVAVALGAAMRFTRFGRDLYAIGAGEKAAAFSGVHTQGVRILVFAVTGGCAAIAGFLMLSQTSFSSPSFGGNLLLLTVVGSVIGGNAISGGIGGVSCALIGALIAAWLRVATVVVGVAPAAQNIVFGVMALIAVSLTTDRAKIGVIK